MFEGPSTQAPLPAPAQASAADFLIASKKSEILDLEGFLRMGHLVIAISNLVHTLQRERGASNLFLGAEGERYGDRLQAMVADTDGEVTRFQAALAELDPAAGISPGDSRLFSRIAYGVHTLTEIDQLRDRVRTLELAPKEAVSIYSELVRGLLAVVFEAADIAMDPAISRTLVAMFNFMQGKELAGQERAAGAAGFALGHFDASLRERMAQLQGGQTRCFELFLEFTDAAARQAWTAVEDSADQGELERLRRLSRPAPGEARREAHRESERGPEREPREIGKNTAEAKGQDKDLAERWFWLATARIDAMKTVEDSLETRLQRLCEEKLRDARQGLAKHQSLIQTLAQQEAPPADSFIIFCSSATAADPGADASRDLNGRVGRSVIELVQHQSQRLQEMHDELNAARAALEERKLLDRAKALLMKHRRMTEEEAYGLLRQTAMNQSRRLVDVARAMVAVGEVWGQPNDNKKDDQC